MMNKVTKRKGNLKIAAKKTNEAQLHILDILKLMNTINGLKQSFIFYNLKALDISRFIRIYLSGLIIRISYISFHISQK